MFKIGSSITRRRRRVSGPSVITPRVSTPIPYQKIFHNEAFAGYNLAAHYQSADTFSIAPGSPALQTGLSLSAAGQLSGTATQALMDNLVVVRGVNSVYGTHFDTLVKISVGQRPANLAAPTLTQIDVDTIQVALPAIPAQIPAITSVDCRYGPTTPLTNSSATTYNAFASGSTFDIGGIPVGATRYVALRAKAPWGDGTFLTPLTGFSPNVASATISGGAFAPIVTSQPSFTPAAAAAGQAITFIAPAADGSPAPSVTLTAATFNGADVLAQVSSNTYTPALPGTLVQTWTITNTAGSVQVSASMDVVASATAPAKPGKTLMAVISSSQIDVTLPADPVDGGSSITRRDLRYSTDGINWTELTGVGSVTALTALPASTGIRTEWRAVNIVGPGSWSDTETAYTAAAISSGSTVVITDGPVSFTVDGVISYGQYADGSYWVNGGGNVVSITQITPVSAQIDRPIAGGGTTGPVWTHGAMIDPGNAKRYYGGAMATLSDRQKSNYYGVSQGYDGAITSANLAFSASLNADPAYTGQPIALIEGTVVKSVGVTDGMQSQGRPTIAYMIPLTVVKSAPAAGSIRPAMALADKTPKWLKSQIDLSKLPNLSSVGVSVPAYATVMGYFTQHTWQYTFNANSRNIVPAGIAGSPVYGGDFYKFTEAILALCYDTWTSAEKLEVATRLVQMAADIAGRADEGGIIQDNGGHASGRKAIVAFAAHVLNNDTYLNTVLNYTAVGGVPAAKPTPAGKSIWGDDAQHAQVSQTVIDTARTYAFPQSMLGYPEFAQEATRGPVSGGTNWQNAIDLATDDVTYKQGYRHISTRVNVPSALGLRLMGAKTLFNNQVFFDYIDRHMSVRLNYGGALPDTNGNDISAWVVQAWNASRGTSGYWNPTGVTQPLSINALPFDGFVFDCARSTNAVVTISGKGTTGNSIQVRGASAGGNTAWFTTTVDANGDWTVSFNLDESLWGNWYTPEARIGINDATKVTSANTFGGGDVIGVMAQSQPEQVLNPSSVYSTGYTFPAQAAQNLTMLTQLTAGGAWTYKKVTSFTLGQVNVAMAALSNVLHLGKPNRKYMIVDMAQSGTSRIHLAWDGESTRLWSDLQNVVDLIRSGGSDVGAVIDCWQADDASTAANFCLEWAPFYFGQRWGGGAFTLGTVNPDSTVNSTKTVDHILWDAEAATYAYGRGIFTRDRTKFIITEYPPFNDASTTTEATNFSSFGGRVGQLDRPARDQLRAFHADPRVPTIASIYGPGMHIADFGADVHAARDGAIWGIPQFGIQFAAPILAWSGYAINDPVITGVTVGVGGAYADVLVNMPPNGVLTTIRALKSLAAPAVQPPHYQPVMGFEIRRAADTDAQRRPVFKTSETSYPAAYRGTVVIQDSGAGTYPNRIAKIRLTPTTAFAANDKLEFLRGEAMAVLLEPRDTDAQTWLDMPIAHIPALYDAAQPYPYYGIPVRPQPDVIVLPSSSAVAPSAFVDADWGVVNAGTGGAGTLTISALPNDGGSAITSIEWRNNSGTPATLSGATTGSYTISGLTDNVQANIEIRAVNSVSAGPWSNVESFTPTSIDSTAPSITGSTPADNATGVAVTGDITINFSEAILLGTTGTIVLRQDTGGGFADLETFDLATDIGTGAGLVHVNGGQLIITPTAALSNLADYAIRIGSTVVKDAAGNFFTGIADDTTLNWKTVSAGSPAFTIANGAAVWFTDPAGMGTVNKFTFVLEADNIPAPGTNAYMLIPTGSNVTLTVMPAGGLRIYLKDSANVVLLNNVYANGNVCGKSLRLVFTVDLIALTASIWINGALDSTWSLAANSGQLAATNRQWSFLATSAGATKLAGTFTRLAMWKNAVSTDGSDPAGAPYHQITGPASVANADSWKLGAGAAT